MAPKKTLLLNGIEVRIDCSDTFNILRYEDIRMHAGTVRFSMSAQKWTSETGAKRHLENTRIAADLLEEMKKLGD